MKYFFSFLLAMGMVAGYAQPQPPIMGWSSWNHFHINIDEKMIRQQADAMKSSGLYKAGYRFINIDDGYFGGRDASGKLLEDKKKFPSGMGALAAYIHSKGLKAGIYTDAGKNTCGSIYDKDPNGFGVGIYGYVKEDCDLFFKEWKYDFLKVDWCGGERMKLVEETEYTKIINAVKAINKEIVFNVCRWKFPGEWAMQKANSWRISGDIRPHFSSILKIIDMNADLWKYASAGHYNDMDMLQVGRGMSYEEDKAHFSMWCMMNSPLLAGNDLRDMSQQTIDILTNKDLIAINQDIQQVQARRILKRGDTEVWQKQLEGEARLAIAILNRSGEKQLFKVDAKSLGLSETSVVRDLWQQEDLGKFGKKERTFSLPAHGIVVLRSGK
ncbi:glycoside hydrolase family 27 protein [Niabella yanshanensis]|uniref:Alpha-galactosidase n=1 Tax=Niabella yanshanensis TaxID=577386 RepID=A0ABZ0W776_9BACT|nr:glycoside hydrolase family 27 protein [Niabella yanshanensis]WQD37870.1 glycoside hydrolase family 27 protein [Niabella yanshanensis]